MTKLEELEATRDAAWAAVYTAYDEVAYYVAFDVVAAAAAEVAYEAAQLDWVAAKSAYYAELKKTQQETPMTRLEELKATRDAAWAAEATAYAAARGAADADAEAAWAAYLVAYAESDAAVTAWADYQAELKKQEDDDDDAPEKIWAAYPASGKRVDQTLYCYAIEPFGPNDDDWIDDDFDDPTLVAEYTRSDIAQARIDELEEALGDVTDACGERKGIWKDLNWIDRRDLKEALGKAAAALKGTNK